MPLTSVPHNLCCIGSLGLSSKPLRPNEGVLLISIVCELLPFLKSPDDFEENVYMQNCE